MSLITGVIEKEVLSNIKNTILIKKHANNFVSENCVDNILEESEVLSNAKLHTIKSLDGIDLIAHEQTLKTEYDFVLLVHDEDKDIKSLDNIALRFLANKINVIRINTRKGLFNYSKEYLDILSWLNYFETLYPNNRFYLYGEGVGANQCATVLKTDVSNLINGIVLDNSNLNNIDDKLRSYCDSKNIKYSSMLFNTVNKILDGKSSGNLNSYLIDDALNNNNIPIIFIKNNKYNDKRFLKFYNSTKSIKKILYLEKFDDEELNCSYKKIVDALKRF